MIFPCNNLSDEEFKVASLFGSTLTEIGIGKMNYEEVQKIQSAITGGISSNFVLLPNAKENKHNLGLKISSKCLEKNEEEMQKLMMQTVSEAKLEDEDRIKDMLNFISSGNERSIIQNGHMLAMSNAGAQVNNIAATNDMAAGINFITNTSNLSKNIDKQDNLFNYLDLFASIKSKIATSPIRTLQHHH